MTIRNRNRHERGRDRKRHNRKRSGRYEPLIVKKALLSVSRELKTMKMMNWKKKKNKRLCRLNKAELNGRQNFVGGAEKRVVRLDLRLALPKKKKLKKKMMRRREEE